MPKSPTRNRPSRRPRPRPRPGATPPTSQLPTTSSLQKIHDRLNTGKKWLQAWIVGFGVVVGIAGFFFALYPKVSINPPSVLDPDKPLSASFRVVNDSYLPVYKVKFACGFDNAQTNVNSGFSNISFQNGRPPIPILKPSEYVETTCPIAEKEAVALKTFDATITVEFDAWWPFPTQTRSARFTSRPNKNGQLQWIPKAESEP
jgi:hypothetical protein